MDTFSFPFTEPRHLDLDDVVNVAWISLNTVDAYIEEKDDNLFLTVRGRLTDEDCRSIESTLFEMEDM